MLSIRLVGLATVIPAVLLGGVAVASTTAASTGAKGCAVSVDRTRAGGASSVTRQVMSNGDCVCYVYAGSSGLAQSDKAIAALARGGRCGGAGYAAAAAQDAGAAPAEETAAAGTGGGISSGAAIGLGVAGVAAAVGGVVAATHNDDSKGG